MVEYFGYYYMFKKLDTDFDDRIKIDDFISGIVQLRQWGGDFKDVKEVKQAFRQYDDNNGGFLLFDEFSLFCKEKNLSIDKD